MFWFCMSAWAVALIRFKFRSIVSNIFYLVGCTGYRQKALRSCYLSIDLGPGSRHFVVSSDPVVESLSRLVPVNLLEIQTVITASSNLNASPQRLRRSGMSATERVGGSIPQLLQSACQSTLGLHWCIHVSVCTNVSTSPFTFYIFYLLDPYTTCPSWCNLLRDLHVLPVSKWDCVLGESVNHYNVGNIQKLYFVPCIAAARKSSHFQRQRFELKCFPPHVQWTAGSLYMWPCDMHPLPLPWKSVWIWVIWSDISKSM